MTTPMPEPAVRIPISRNKEEDTILFEAAQMEAYAAAKVREALETAIRECRSQFHDWALEVNESNEGESSMEEVEEIVRLSFIERRIRALIPSTPA